MVGGQRAVAVVPWERRIRQMSDRTIQHRGVVAFNHHACQTHARDLQRADGHAVRERRRSDGRPAGDRQRFEVLESGVE
jgi:hypothetical protein